jgi:hypothetical protein
MIIEYEENNQSRNADERVHNNSQWHIPSWNKQMIINIYSM